MSAYSGGGSGSGDTHTPKMISGRKPTPTKVAPAKVYKATKAAPKKAVPKKRGS